MLEKLLALYQKEPLVIRGVLVAIAALIATFGIELSATQIGAAWALIEAVLMLVSRASVYSPSSVAAIVSDTKIQTAAAMGVIPEPSDRRPHGDE